MEYFNIINDRYIELAKSPTLYPKFKVELVDISEKNVIKEIIQDIDAESGGSISINYQQGVRMSCNLNIINYNQEYSPSYETGIFYINSKFKLYVGLKDDKNDDIYWFSEGVYYVTNPTNNHQFSSKYVTINGTDKFAILGGDLGFNQIVGTYKINAGTKIYSAIKDILMLDIGNGYVIDPIEPLLDPVYKDEVLPYDINKSSGSYMGDILIEFANILGANVYYDKNGRLNIESSTTDISYSQESPIWDFTDIETEYMDSSLNYDYTKVINSVTVIGTNTNDKIYEYTAENNNPLSPTRIEYIGRKQLEPIETPMAYNDDRAKDYAEYQLNKLSILQSLIDFNCSLIPHLDVDLVCNITDKYYKYQQQRFIIQSISMPLNTTGLMRISASNIATLPYYDLLIGG